MHLNSTGASSPLSSCSRARVRYDGRSRLPIPSLRHSSMLTSVTSSRLRLGPADEVRLYRNPNHEFAMAVDRTTLTPCHQRPIASGSCSPAMTCASGSSSRPTDGWADIRAQRGAELGTIRGARSESRCFPMDGWANVLAQRRWWLASRSSRELRSLCASVTKVGPSRTRNHSRRATRVAMLPDGRLGRRPRAARTWAQQDSNLRPPGS